MIQETMQRREIWSKWLRISHWAMAASTLALMASGWLVTHSPSVANAASDWHYIAGGILSLSLLGRITLMVTDKGTAGWLTLLQPPEWSKVAEMIRFYVSFGRMPLPKWYAHNPLWKPLYLMLFILIALAIASGYLQSSHPVLFGLYLPKMHHAVTTLISILVVAHILAVFLHDAKGDSNDISAMVNGKRLFVIQPVQPAEVSGVHIVSLDQLKAGLKKPGEPDKP